MRLLLAEDNRELAHWLEKALVQEGFAVDCVSDGRAADHLLQGEHYAVAILDIGMPGFDGLEVVHRLRKRGQTLPVLFLTARSNVADRVKGLNAGADDYLTKPFDMRELLARIRAMTRRKEEFAQPNLACGNLSLDRSSFELTTPDHEPVRLAGREFQMMEMLMTTPGRVISVDTFMDHIWADGDADVNVVWVYISNLSADCNINLDI